DEAGSTRFRYNGFGNVVSKTQTTTANGVAKDQTIAYAYGTSGSSTGHVVSATYPSGSVVGYSYNSAGRIAGLTLTTANGSVALLSNIQYQPFGKPSGWTWGNGTAYTRSFDLSGRLIQFPLGATTGTGTTPNGLSRTVNYDAASRISAYTHTDTSGSTGSSTATAANQTFGYDDQDRLISYLPANSSQSYSYDANGNRTGQTIGGASYTQTVDPASNRQTASTGPTPATNSYDAAGNQTGDGSTTYSYSDRGRLASVTKNGTTTSYLYNGLGQRVVKSGSNVPTGAVRYVYDEAGHLIGEYDQSGNALQETVYLGDTPIATLKNGTPYYIYADQIDTPRVITDTNNLMVWRWDQTDPFGAMLPDENPTGLGAFTYNLRFPGQVYDAETGKHYNVNRDYDPAGGRYVQSDPIGLKGGQWSTYTYVNGNPITKKDPTGLIEWNGTVLSGTLGAGVISGGVDFYTIRSQCINGKRVVVKVKAEYVAAGIGAPWSYTGSSVTFNDPFSDADPNIFNGDYSRVSSGVSFGGGYSWSAVQMGHAGSSWSGSPEAGLDLTYLAWSLRGRSQVVSSNTESCGCE
ncbi:RHS repeat-associated core domain-containing protein, partial [Ralstonia solanacearum]|uniref:RHS repeat-associated core domain-containing protein n=1 Tax=Ralstonia solanacearum TaxID=305 RepID=UPI0035180C74